MSTCMPGQGTLFRAWTRIRDLKPVDWRFVAHMRCHKFGLGEGSIEDVGLMEKSHFARGSARFAITKF